MTSGASSDFWACFDRLPTPIQRMAREKYQLWQADPQHPSLRFKELRPGLWSVRISQQYRA